MTPRQVDQVLNWPRRRAIVFVAEALWDKGQTER
jgi:hypothetical protein